MFSLLLLKKISPIFFHDCVLITVYLCSSHINYYQLFLILTNQKFHNRIYFHFPFIRPKLLYWRWCHQVWLFCTNQEKRPNTVGLWFYGIPEKKYFKHCAKLLKKLKFRNSSMSYQQERATIYFAILRLQFLVHFLSPFI